MQNNKMNNNNAIVDTNRHKLLSKHDDYNFAHVGGNTYTDNNHEYIRQQSEIVNNRNKLVPKTYIPPYDFMEIKRQANSVDNKNMVNGGTSVIDDENIIDIRNKQKIQYDEMADYLYKNGLIDRDNRSIFTTKYITIDSRSRNKIPKSVTKSPQQLEKNPLYLSETSDDNVNIMTKLCIKHANHGYKVNDMINITGLQNRKVILRTKGSDPPTFNFVTGDKYLRIKYVNATGVDNAVYQGVGNFAPWDLSDSADLFITISGFKGTSSTDQFIGNIPVNMLNKKHKVYFETETEPYNDNIIFIELPTVFNTGTQDQAYVFPSSYNVELLYHYISGIPTNLINAEYPIDNTRIQGLHTIDEIISNDIYSFKINHRAGNYAQFGGSNIYVSQVIEVIDGNVHPNLYSIPLTNEHTNVIYASLKSSEFPNTERNVKTLPINRKNNAFYWQNVVDGDHVYSVEIDSGNYDATTIAQLLETLINSTPKINFTNSNTLYTKNNNMKVSIDANTSIVTIKSFREAILIQPFESVSPAISGTPNSLDPTTVTIQVKHIGHGLSVNDAIIISGAVTHLGISAFALNGEFLIKTIIDANNYTIVLNNLNLETSRVSSKGGNAVKIFVPNIFRLRLDYADSVCSILGFRDVGKSTSITNYVSIITNKDEYEDEIKIDNSGKEKVFSNNLLQLSSEKYFFMVCPQLGNVFGPIDGIFNKISLDNNFGKIMYNTFAPIPHTYSDPIPQLYKLDFSFRYSDGSLFDFDDIDHSFTIEIVTANDVPKGTYFNSHIGKFV
jgi:hypothetical protein